MFTQELMKLPEDQRRTAMKKALDEEGDIGLPPGDYVIVPCTFKRGETGPAATWHSHPSSGAFASK